MKLKHEALINDVVQKANKAKRTKLPKDKKKVMSASFKLEKSIPGSCKHSVYYDGHIFENIETFQWWLFLWVLYANKGGIGYDHNKLIPTFTRAHENEHVYFQVVPKHVSIKKEANRIAVYEQVKPSISNKLFTLVLLQSRPHYVSYYALVKKKGEAESEYRAVLHPNLLLPGENKVKVPTQKMMDTFVYKNYIYRNAIESSKNTVRYVASDRPI